MQWVDAYKLTIGRSYLLQQQTPLMPKPGVEEESVTDIIDLMELVISLEEHTVIKVLSKDAKTNWYKVQSRFKNEKVFGWINPVALLNQIKIF